MFTEGCQLTVSLSVDVDYSSLENVGTYVFDMLGTRNQKLVVGITGDTSDLGSWNPEKGLFCKYQKADSLGIETWFCCFSSDLCRSFHYRYFVAEIRESNDEYSDSTSLKLLAWESRVKPRKFSIIDYMNCEDKHSLTHVKFGVYDNGTFIQRGWLTNTSELHVRLLPSGCKFFSSYLSGSAQQTMYISCSKYILDIAVNDDFDVDTILSDRPLEDGLDDITNLRLAEQLSRSLPSPVLPGISTFTPNSRIQPVLLSTLEINRCRVHRGEKSKCFGTLYKPGDEVTFYVETNDIENTAILIEFYKQESRPVSTNSPSNNHPSLRLLGSARFGPFEDTHGRKASQILNVKQLPIGDLRVQYLVIHPMTKAPTPSLAVTYQHYWKKRKTIDIGHRGMGTSFLDQTQKNIKKPANNKENTLDSFRTAVQHGADFVEMDVQLTKDNRVVVYHDFEAVVISKKKRGGRLSYLPVAIKDLNYDDLRELKVHHSSVMQEQHTHEKMDEEDLDPIEKQSFPLLRSCLNELDPDLGFVIEVKYPMYYKAGGCELSNFFEYNFYVDTILREILSFAGSRRILLSCFDPNVCIMLQLKQNIYPVFQLGIAPEYSDTRQSNFEQLFWSAVSHQLLGVCLESDRLLDVPDVIKLAHHQGLVVLAWGEAVNSRDKRAQLSEFGVDGIIYDTLNESKERGTLNIFKQTSQAPSPEPSGPNPVVAPNFGDAMQQVPSLGHFFERQEGDDPQLAPSPTKIYGPTHVAVVKERVEFEKLSHTNSTTTCESIPPTTLSTTVDFRGSPETEVELEHDPDNPPPIGTVDEKNADPEVTGNKKGSAQRVVPLITLA